MFQLIIKESLERLDPDLVVSSSGICRALFEKLRDILDGSLTETELEEYVFRKLEDASTNIERLQKMRVPDLAAKQHELLYRGFDCYEIGLEALEAYLWGPEGNTFTLEEIIHKLQCGDSAIEYFQSEMAVHTSPLTGVDLLW